MCAHDCGFRWRACLAVLTLTVGLLAGCAADGGGSGSGPGDDDDTSSATGTGTGGDDECEGVDFPVAGRPPAFLIVLDSSSSMQAMDSWTNVVTAITTVTAQLDWQVRFGLLIFPDGQELCAMTSPWPEVPVGDFNAGEIATVLGESAPNGGGTPTARALLYGFQHLLALSGDSDRFVILATDGAPNCSDDPGLTCQGGCVSSVDGNCEFDEICLDDQAVYAHAGEYYQNWGIATYVVGLGGVVEMWDDVMSTIALHGGTGDYYPALDPQALVDALQEIAAENTDCTFDVDWGALDIGTSSDPGLVNVETDGDEILFSADCADAQGWHWLDEDTIELCPGLCHDYKWGIVHVIHATFGCESVVE
ncbi:MAG TPA: vWA domain-containing protein [Polyangia bacterium]|nr:vWA domain-containing protein [Polyangia bacterium]